jgi:hypothetical protein
VTLQKLHRTEADVRSVIVSGRTAFWFCQQAAILPCRIGASFAVRRFSELTPARRAARCSSAEVCRASFAAMTSSPNDPLGKLNLQVEASPPLLVVFNPDKTFRRCGCGTFRQRPAISDLLLQGLSHGFKGNVQTLNLVGIGFKPFRPGGNVMMSASVGEREMKQTF